MEGWLLEEHTLGLRASGKLFGKNLSSSGVSDASERMANISSAPVAVVFDVGYPSALVDVQAHT
jgi:hypothetical protein